MDLMQRTTPPLDNGVLLPTPEHPTQTQKSLLDAMASTTLWVPHKIYLQQQQSPHEMMKPYHSSLPFL